MAPTELSYQTLYKKKPGTLAYNKSTTTLTWTPSKSSTPLLTIPMSAVTNLQQTPASNPNVIIKVFHLPQGKTEAESVALQFSSPTSARAEKDVLMEEMRQVIESAKAAATTSKNGGSKVSTPAPGSGTVSDANSTSDPPRDPTAQYYSNTALISNQALHKAYLEANPTVNTRLMTLHASKPASQTISDFYASFWSTRLPALRLFALERAQKKGAYNVLASIKISTDSEGKLKLNIAGEQIALLLEQHPIVAKAFKECVNKERGIATAEEFWTRFFTSRLYKRLRGERLNPDTDRRDPVLDRYLEQGGDQRRIANEGNVDPGQAASLQQAVPHFIDLSGNESNIKWRGNAPDQTMRAGSMAADRISAFDGYNNISSQLVSNVVGADAGSGGSRAAVGNLHAPVGSLDTASSKNYGADELGNLLRLQDLAGEAGDDPLRLNVKTPKAFSRDRHHHQELEDGYDITPRLPGESIETAIDKLSELDWNLDLAKTFDADAGGTFILPRQSTANPA